MAYRNFREFLDALRQQDDIIEVDRSVDLYLEVGKALKNAYANEGPAVIFNNNGTAFPLVGGLYSTRSKALLAFEATEETIFDKFADGLAHPIPSVLAEGAAPVQEVVITGDAVNIYDFPVPTYSSKDGGPFITPGIVVSKDPVTGVPDIGHYRFQVVGKNKLSFLAQPFHRFGKNIARAKQLGRTKFEGALVIGTDPVLAYTCQVQVSDTTDDFAVAGGLRKEAVELVKAVSVDVEVPAEAEVVIEFVVDFNEEILEGPLGEYTGYYTPSSFKPVATITAITHRQKPYFQALLTGKPVTENHILKELPFEVSFYKQLKAQFPTVEKVYIPPSGGVSFYVVVAMKPRYAGEARHVILAALASNIRPKHVIVVDPDIDIYDATDVQWALSFRVQPDRDVIVVGGLPAGPLDPSVGEKAALAERTGSAMGIDATIPFGEEFPEVADVEGWRDYDFPELRKIQSFKE